MLQVSSRLAKVEVARPSATKVVWGCSEISTVNLRVRGLGFPSSHFCLLIDRAFKSSLGLNFEIDL